MQVTASIFRVYSFTKLQWHGGLCVCLVFFNKGNYVIKKQGIEELALRILCEKKIFKF